MSHLIKMKQPESVIHALLSDLKVCSLKRDLQRGREIHKKAVQSRNDKNMYIVTALINLYGKCGRMVDARLVFDSVDNPDVVSWNALLLGYANNGEGLASLDMFKKMKASGCGIDSVTYLAALKACTSLAHKSRKEDCLKRGRQIHSQIGCHLNHCVQNTLIDMYAKCGSMLEARKVFDSLQKPDVVSWTTMLLGYAENGDGLVALEMFSRMKSHGCCPNSITYIAAIKACTSLAVSGDGSKKEEYLKWGREIHLQIECHHLNHYVKNTLIDMYSKCGSMVDARSVFYSVQQPDVVAWSAMILGYAENGNGLAGLEMFSRMETCRISPNSITFIGALKACTSLAQNDDGSGKGDCLERGRKIHSHIGCHLNIYVQNALIDMYAKCGSMVEAREVFDCIQNPDVVAWTTLVLGYADNGNGVVGLEIFSRMKACGCRPNSVTYVAALRACTSLVDDSGKKYCLERGREIHLDIGCHLNHYVQNTLIAMYAKCGSMVEARDVFDNVQKPDVVSWTAMLLGYAENGEELVAVEVISRMKARGCRPNSVTYVAALKTCASIGALALGRKLHLEIDDIDASLLTCLVDFYAKCGSMVEARKVFDLHLKKRNASTWTALLAGYSSLGDCDSVFSLFEAMQDDGFRPDAVTFVCMLLCCSHAGLVEKGRSYFEAMTLQHGITPTVVHYTCMVDILGRVNQLNEAILMIRKMPCNPNAVTWRTLLGACRKWKNVNIGMLAFQSLLNFDKKDASLYVAMAQTYGSVGMLEEQERLLKMKAGVGTCKLPGQAYIMDEMGKVVNFVVGEQDSREVENMFQQLCKGMKEHEINSNEAAVLIIG